VIFSRFLPFTSAFSYTFQTILTYVLTSEANSIFKARTWWAGCQRLAGLHSGSWPEIAAIWVAFHPHLAGKLNTYSS